MSKYPRSQRFGSQYAVFFNVEDQSNFAPSALVKVDIQSTFFRVVETTF